MNRARREQQRRLGIKHSRVYQLLNLFVREVEEAPPAWFMLTIPEGDPGNEQRIEKERSRLSFLHAAAIQRSKQEVIDRLTGQEWLELMNFTLKGLDA